MSEKEIVSIEDMLDKEEKRLFGRSGRFIRIGFRTFYKVKRKLNFFQQYAETETITVHEDSEVFDDKRILFHSLSDLERFELEDRSFLHGGEQFRIVEKQEERRTVGKDLLTVTTLFKAELVE